MPTYRVFVTRHYIDVCFFDVEARTSRRAKTLARKAAYKLKPDARATATDNGWIPDSPVTIPAIGSSSCPFDTTEVIPGVHAPQD